MPRGGIRQKAESALQAYSGVLAAIEESDAATRSTLSDFAPKLRSIADLLLDIAEARESDLSAGARHGQGGRRSERANFAENAHAADAELSGAAEKLLRIRARVVRVSIEGEEEASSRAAELARSLDEWKLQLDTLKAGLSPREEG